MKINNSRGFSAVETLLILILIGLLGGVGYYVYSQNQTEETSEPTANTQQEPAKEEETATVKTYEGMKYTVPTGWKNVQQNVKPYEEGSGSYLLSPDYKEGNGGQLTVEKGAFISFSNLEWEDIDASTTVQEAANKVKNGEGGYLDSDSVKVSTIAGKQVVMYDAGHTTDGVVVMMKSSSDKWLEASFGTLTGEDGKYNAQDSPLYDTFTSWVENFVKLNS